MKFKSLIWLVLIAIFLNLFVKKLEKILTADIIQQFNPPVIITYNSPPSEHRYIHLVDKYSKLHNVDPRLVLAVIRVESNFQPKAVSKMGATGLMQIMPTTYYWICEKYNLPKRDLYDPSVNIQIGTLYLSMLMEQHKSVRRVLAAYNGGSNSATRYPNVSTDVLSYVEKVMQGYNSYMEMKS